MLMGFIALLPAWRLWACKQKQSVQTTCVRCYGNKSERSEHGASWVLVSQSHQPHNWDCYTQGQTLWSDPHPGSHCGATDILGWVVLSHVTAVLCILDIEMGEGLTCWVTLDPSSWQLTCFQTCWNALWGKSTPLVEKHCSAYSSIGRTMALQHKRTLIALEWAGWAQWCAPTSLSQHGRGRGRRILSLKTAWVTRLNRETVSQKERREGKKSEKCVSVWLWSA